MRNIHFYKNFHCFDDFRLFFISREFAVIYYTYVLTWILLLFLNYIYIWIENPPCTFFAHAQGGLVTTPNSNPRQYGQWKFDHLKSKNNLYHWKEQKNLSIFHVSTMVGKSIFQKLFIFSWSVTSSSPFMAMCTRRQ